ncbi:MAG: hypothetical protein RR400_00950 [Clostridia bacterium]
MRFSKKFAIQNIIIAILAIALLAVVSISASGAWFKDNKSLENKGEIAGAISISLIDGDSKEILVGSDSVTYFAGDKISSPVAIKLASTSPTSIIRVKFNVRILDAAGNEKTTTTAKEKEFLTAISSQTNLLAGFEKTLSQAGYNYYSSIVSANAEVLVSSGVKMPESIDNSFAGIKFGISIIAEAMQSSNASSTIHPWHADVISVGNAALSESLGVEVYVGPAV